MICFNFSNSSAMRFLTRHSPQRSALCLVKSIESNDDLYAFDGSRNSQCFLSFSLAYVSVTASSCFSQIYVFVVVLASHTNSLHTKVWFLSTQRWRRQEQLFLNAKAINFRCFIHTFDRVLFRQKIKISWNACTMFAFCNWTIERRVRLGCCDSASSDFTGILCHRRFDSVAPIRMTA